MIRRALLIFLVLPALCAAGAFAQDVPDAEAAALDSMDMSNDYPMANYTSPKMYILNKVTVHGVKHIDTSMLATTAGLIPGDTVYIPGRYISRAMKNLTSRRYFADAKIVAEPVGDSVNLELYLEERPRVYQWLFNGVSKGEEKEIREKLGLRKGNELTDYLLNRHKNYIAEFLSAKGFRNVTVDTKIENDDTYPNAVNVTFKVEKNKKVKIGEINFEGNEAFTDKRLRRTLKKTHEKSINIFRGAKLKSEDYENDKENLIDFYNSKGYRNANIVGDSIYQINEKRLGIRITVDEGNKYYYRNISWVGNSVYETDFLRRLMVEEGIEPGAIYDKKALHKSLGIGKELDLENPRSLSSLYANDGYLFFQVEPSEMVVGADSIDMEIRIFEGKQAIINNVTISGNTRVDDQIIRRELYTRPGELYDRSMLMATLRQLMQMKHFNPESLSPGIVPVSNELVDIAWPLEETASDRFEISGGVGGGMFVGSVGVELNNLSIRNFFKKGSWRPYPHGQGQSFRVQAQTNGKYYKAFSMSFTEPWLGGRKPISLTVGAHYSDENNAYYVFQKPTRFFRTVGLSVGIGRRLSWPDPYFTLYNEVSFQTYRLKDWYNFVVNNGSSNILALTTVFSRSTVDQPIYPRRGSEFAVTLALTPPFSLFDNRDYTKEMSNNARFGWIEYHKWRLKGQWFVPISGNENLVLMTKMEMGYLGHYNRNRISPFEGFDMGGSGMTGYNLYGVDMIGLRGYDDSSITPVSSNSEYAKVFNKYTVELRYPLLMQPATQIYGLVFAEGGNAFRSWQEFNPFQIKRALGVGVRANLQIVGMIGIDWGFGFDKAAGASKRNGSKLTFILGQQF